MEPDFHYRLPCRSIAIGTRIRQQTGLDRTLRAFVVGRELANGYSELNDPEDQAERFKAQVAQKDAGDDEAMHYDADYIRAMEFAYRRPAAAASASTAW